MWILLYIIRTFDQILYKTKHLYYVQVYMYNINMWQINMSNRFKQKYNMITKLSHVIDYCYYNDII